MTEAITPRHEAPAEPVSDRYKFDDEIAWLREAARYFSARDTKGEDRAHWANVYNAENARKLADRLAELSSNPCQLEAPAEGAGEDELTLRGLATLINGYARDRDREGLPQTAETLRHAALIIDHYRELRARSSAPEARS